MQTKPNVLVLFTDQQRKDTIHALGNERIVTPALDSLAEEAVVFDQCYSPAPVCVPARFSMYSGLYPAHSGCSNNNTSHAYQGEGFYADFTAAGYQTCCVGKMHHTDLYGPMGFAQRYTQEEMAAPEDDYTKFLLSSPYSQVFDYNGMRSELYYIPQISQLPQEVHPTQWVGDRSIEFLNGYSGEKPFFLMSSFIHPHPPFAPPSPWNKMYRSVAPDPYMPDDPAEFQDFLSDRFVLDRVGISRQDLTLLKNYYYACISFVDYQVSRILDKLKELQVYDQTIILFASDHGEMLGDFGTMGKRSMLDAASRVPFLLRVPGLKNTVRTDVCSLVDVAPTLRALCGIESCEVGDGLDLFGEKRHDHVYSQYSTGKAGTYMIASNHDRLIYSGPHEKYYYFDTTPEDANKFSPDNPRVCELKGLLDNYIGSDVGSDGSGGIDAVSGVSKFPYGPKRADHLFRHEDELACMPAGYQIDL